MVVFSNKESIPKNKSLHIHQSIGVLHNKNIQLLKKKFYQLVDCKSTKEILQKDVKNLASKQIFARWQAILSVFDFEIEYSKGTSNSLPDYLTREFLQEK
ncbi:hypothetical protein CR513_19817, partial [Mucuna pruriens]